MRPKPPIFKVLSGNEQYARDQVSKLIWHRCRHRVLYADTDRSQLVYHSNYLIYFELGRSSLMRDAAYPYRLIEENGYVYPIIQIGVNYYKLHHFFFNIDMAGLRFAFDLTFKNSIDSRGKKIVVM